MDDTTLDTLSGEHQVKIGGQIAATIGPMGREAEVAFNISEKGAGGTYTYTFSKGVFGGISLETAIMNVRSKENERFYGKAAKAKEILWEDVVEAPKGKGIEEVSSFYGYCGPSLHSCESISHKKYYRYSCIKSWNCSRKARLWFKHQVLLKRKTHCELMRRRLEPKQNHPRRMLLRLMQRLKQRRNPSSQSEHIMCIDKHSLLQLM